MTTVSERVLEALLETAIDYAIISMDLDGIVTSWSEGARLLLGWTAAEMIGRPVSVIFTAEDRDRGVPRAEMEAALAHGRGNDERWHQRRDSTLFWANGEMMPLRDTAGHVHGLIKILRDRTAARMIEERQRSDTEFLRSVLASSGDCIKVLDLDGRVVQMNEAGLRLMEVSDFNDIRGCPWQALWADHGNNDALGAMAAARAGGVGKFQGKADTFAGNPRFWDVQVTPILDGQGRPDKLLAVSRDITAARLAELALREAQALNTLILESSQDCIVVLDLDAQTQFISPGGVAAMEIDDLTTVLGQSWLRVWQGEHLALAEAALAEACAGRVGRFQASCLTHRGTLKWWDMVVSPLRGADGRPDRLVSVGRDITQARQAQHMLIVSEERLQLALAASPDVGIWDVDLVAGTVYGDANFARMHGIDAEAAAAGAPVTAIFRNLHPDDAAALVGHLDALIGGEETLLAEHRLVQPDGSERWVVAHGRLVRDRHGTPVRLPGSVVDVTERRQSEQRQRLLMEELTHRVKNTLAVVQSIARQTLRGDGAMAEARESFSSRLLALSAAHDVLMQGSWTHAGLRELVETAAGLHAPLRAATPRFTITGPDVTLGPRAALAMGLVLHELGTNAVKYGALSTADGHVDVRWSLTGEGMLQFSWREAGGPAVPPPTHRGFGSRLIERSLVSELQAVVDYAYPPEGVSLTLTTPLDAL